MSRNQQGVTGAINTNFGMSYDNYWVTNTQSGWIPHNDHPASLYQTKLWPHTEHQVWQSTAFHSNTQMCHDWGQAVGNQSLNVMQQADPHSSKQLPTKTFAPNPQARITLGPSTNGGFKATVMKRKRKRTMFTTEQIQTMESFFINKPYITREERQIFVDNLRVSDSAVKVWFQNRRLREKRDREEREAEALELANSLTEETLYYSQNNPYFKISTPALAATPNDLSNYFSMSSFDADPVTVNAIEIRNSKTNKNVDIDHLLNTTYVNMTECVDNKISQNNEDSGIDSDSSRITRDSLSNMVVDSCTDQLERVNLKTMQDNTAVMDSNESSCSPSLDDIEADIEKKTDEFGYVTLDDKAIGDLVSVLVNVLPTDVNLETLCVKEETAEDSDSTTYAGSIYEPISPAVSDIDEEILQTKWKPFAPEKSLQKLFDLHFC